MGHLVAIAGDMDWDGEHIDGMSNDDAMLLTGLHPAGAKPRTRQVYTHSVGRGWLG
jgi:hypothetical protein